jgi:hypothetical protein
MDNTFLAEIHGRLNRAKVLLKIVLVSASLGFILSILTDFLPYEITEFAVGAVILLASTSILWYLAGRDLISTFHDLMKTPFERLGKLEEFLSGNIDPKALIALRQSQIPDSTLKDLFATFKKYFDTYASIFYTLEFVGFLNVIFYILLVPAPKVIKNMNFSIPLQPFVGFLTIAVPVTVSIALGLTEWRGDSLLNNPRCILDLLDNLKSRKLLLFSDLVFLFLFFMISFFFMPITLTPTLTPQLGVILILGASAIIGIDLGFLAGIVHHLMLGASYRDFVYLNCLYRQVIDKAAQQAQDIVKQGAQHPASQGQGT